MDYQAYLPALQVSLKFFAAAMVELSLLFIGISFFVGVLNEFLPRERMQLWLSGKRGRGYLVGALLGSLTPFCSCSTIPIMAGMLRAGAAFGPVMAFLLTSPLVNPVILALFISLLGIEVALWYGAMAVILAICAGSLLENLGFSRYIKTEMLAVGAGRSSGTGGTSRPGAAPCCPAPALQAIDSLQPLPTTSCCAASQSVGLTAQVDAISVEPNRWLRIFREALEQFVALLPYILVGVAIGSIIYGFLPANLVVRLAGPDNPLAIPVAAVVGVPLYLRASTMIPIAAGLMAKGMGLGAVIALIIGGAGASLPEVAMLKGLFKTQLVAAFLGVVFAMAVTAGSVIGILL